MCILNHLNAEQNINCRRMFSNMIYYTIDDMKKVAMTKKYNCGSSIYLACIILLSRYWTYAFKKRHINWKRTIIRREDMRKDPFSTPATIQHYPILAFLYQYIPLSIPSIVVMCWTNTTDKNTKRKFIWHCINTQNDFLKHMLEVFP